MKQNNGKILLVYRKSTHTDQYLHYSSHHQTTCKESVVSSLFNRAYSIITNKNDLTNENVTIKQVLKENRYRERIICKNFKRITNNHILFQSQQHTEATGIHEHDIKMSINLTYVAKRMKLRGTVGKQVTTLVGIRRKLLIWKVG